MAHRSSSQQTPQTEHLPPLLSRNTSPSTGISYISSGSNDLTPAPLKLFLCFHGWACAATDFAPLLSTLASLETSSPSRNLYIAIDLPGHGRSPASLCPKPTVPAFAGLANQLRAEVSPQGKLLDTVLVGHSMGCRMALEAFVQERVKVAGIILIDGSWVGRMPEIHVPPVVGDRRTEILRIVDRIGAFGPLTPESFKEEMVMRLRGIDLEYEYELGRTYIKWDREKMEGALGEIGDADVSVKLLAVQSTQGRGPNRRSLKSGEEGPWVPFVRDKVGRERFQSAVLEDCGHWPHIDKVEEVAQVISSFTGGVTLLE